MTNLSHLFVPYEIALKLKENGFDEICLMSYCTGTKWDGYVLRMGYHDNGRDITFDKSEYGIPAPTYQQVIDFFREKKSIHIAVSSTPVYNLKYGYQVSRGSLTGGYTPDFETGQTYYGAFHKAIIEALKYI